MHVIQNNTINSIPFFLTKLKQQISKYHSLKIQVVKCQYNAR